MNTEQRTTISKTIAHALRHAPEEYGLALYGAGWAPTDDLLEGLKVKGVELDMQGLRQVVFQCPKQRFQLSTSGTQIRARYGHSAHVEPMGELLFPPHTLYHGTTAKALERIVVEGIQPMSRRMVHLSESVDEACLAADRHGGTTVILPVPARSLYADGFKFYSTGEGLWSVREVPPRYLRADPSGE